MPSYVETQRRPKQQIPEENHRPFSLSCSNAGWTINEALHAFFDWRCSWVAWDKLMGPTYTLQPVVTTCIIFHNVIATFRGMKHHCVKGARSLQRDIHRDFLGHLLCRVRNISNSWKKHSFQHVHGTIDARSWHVHEESPFLYRDFLWL